MKTILTLLLVGLSVGLGNFAASVAIGLGGVNKSLRLRIALIFGLFETGMPIIGLVIGQKIAHDLGGHANLIGGSLLGLTGIYLVVSSLRKTDTKEVSQAVHSWGKLLIAGLSLSIDNLIVGFGLGTRHQSLLLAAVIIGATSVCLALLGLEIGNKLNSKVEEYSELFSGLILVTVGILIGLQVL
ncbi:MAG TPA: manganese efflux pump [Candidatus Saccharimonadales bacterium]|jgi:putative Mn2+ efflux pump MntP